MSKESKNQEKLVQRLIEQTARNLLRIRSRHHARLEALKLRTHEEQREFLAMLADGMREQVNAAALRMMVDCAIDNVQNDTPSVEQGLAAIEPEMADE